MNGLTFALINTFSSYIVSRHHTLDAAVAAYHAQDRAHRGQGGYFSGQIAEITGGIPKAGQDLDSCEGLEIIKDAEDLQLGI